MEEKLPLPRNEGPNEDLSVAQAEATLVNEKVDQLAREDDFRPARQELARKLETLAGTAQSSTQGEPAQVYTPHLEEAIQQVDERISTIFGEIIPLINGGDHEINPHENPSTLLKEKITRQELELMAAKLNTRCICLPPAGPEEPGNPTPRPAVTGLADSWGKHNVFLVGLGQLGNEYTVVLRAVDSESVDTLDSTVRLVDTRQFNQLQKQFEESLPPQEGMQPNLVNESKEGGSQYPR